jgi:hypothetical protein
MLISKDHFQDMDMDTGTDTDTGTDGVTDTETDNGLSTDNRSCAGLRYYVSEMAG